MAVTLRAYAMPEAETGAKQKAYARKHKKLGLCTNCPEPSEPGKTRCRNCREKHKKRRHSFSTVVNPCPNCGTYELKVRPFVATVECCICGLRGPIVRKPSKEFDQASAEKAIEQWNRIPSWR